MKAPKALIPLLVCTVLAWAPEKLRVDSRAVAHTAGAGATPASQVFQATSSDDFTLVLLPDTQYYSAQANGATLAMFTAQTQWVADNKLSENIKAVIGLGDIVNCGNRTTEWQNASAAYAILDSAGVPYVPAIGNHDYEQVECGLVGNRPVTNFNSFFGPARLSAYPWYGASTFPRGSNENFYVTFTAGSRHYLVLALEFFPRDSALAWAQGILNANPDKEVIVTTHAYLYNDDTRATDTVANGPERYGLVADNNGEEMWDKFIRKNASIIAVVNGHFLGDGLGRRVDAGDHGNLVAQMLSNYQAQPNGGGGFLRILTFRPSLGIIEVKTFSPFLNQFKTDPDNEFTIPYQGIVTPRIDSVQPPQGPIAGGTTVTLKGAHLSGAILKVNKTAVTPLSQTDTEIRFTTPPQDNGIALISIRSAAGAGYGEFLYLPPRLDEIPPGYITTIAGAGLFVGDGRLATQAMVQPADLALHSDGSIYLGQGDEPTVRRIRPDGIIERFAGTAIPAFSGDGGPALDAQFSLARGIALDSAGNLYISDPSNHRIRRVDASTGIITTIAGTGTPGFSGDGGRALQAQLYNPTRIVVDNQGNILFVDQINIRIRRISPAGIISTFAGNGTAGFSGDGGPATEAQINPGGFAGEPTLAVDQDGNVYLADQFNDRIRKINRQTGIITTIAEAGRPKGIAVDTAGNICFGNIIRSAAHGDRRIICTDRSGQVSKTFGEGRGFSPDGVPAQDAPMGGIDAIAIDSSGNILFAEFSSWRLRRINAQTGLLETLAGIGPAIIGETGPAMATVLNNLNSDIALLPTGELLVGDSENRRLRKIDAQGNIRTIAGNGFHLDFVDEVPALETSVLPYGIEADGNGNIFVADTTNIRRIDPNGIIHRAAGTRELGFSGDGGLATEARLMQPWEVAVDKDGDLFIPDSNNNRIRRVDARSGTISTVAGSGPSNGPDNYGAGTFCGDGGSALNACLNTPYAVAVDKYGNLFIADTYNGRIRIVDPNGIITSVAQVGWHARVVFDSSGNLYTATPNRVLRISPDGATVMIAGGDETGFAGDGGPALQARIDTGSGGIAIDGHGNLFFVDGANRRVRAIKFGAIVAPHDGIIEARAGTPQQTKTGTLFPLVLVAGVRDAASNPAVGTQVTFTAPASGPTCTFPNGQTTFTTLTDRFGHAGVTCRASSLVGSFTITAAALGLAQTAQFQLTNFGNPSNLTPVPAGAVTTFIPHIVSGQGFLTRLTLVNLTGNTNNIRIHFLTQSGAVESTFSRTLTAAGASAELSTGESERFTQPQTRWAAIGSDFPVGVTVFFELKHAPHANPATGVGFSAPRLLRQLVLPVRFEPATPQPFTVGIALANPTGQSNPISVTLRDAQGNAVAQDSSLTLPAFGQTAFLFTDLPGLKPFLAGQPSFKGSVAIAAGQPLSAIGVGDDFGPFFAIEPFEGTACLPLFCTATTSAIPHIVAGDGLRTVITLVNLTGGTNTVAVQRFNQDGTQGQAVNVSLPPSGRFEIDTGEQARFAPAITQWATLQTQGPVGVNVFFDLKHRADAELVTAVGFSNLQPSATFTLPAAFARPAAVLGQTEPLTLGLALANPANDFSRVTLRLLDENGALVAEDSSAQLAPKGQTAFVVSELPEIKRFLQNRPPFRGLLSISATQPLAPLAVGDDFGPFFALPVLSALSH